MMKSTTIRMDDDLKKEASAKLEALGLNFNTATCCPEPYPV